MHEVLVNRLGGLSLPRKSVVRLTDRPDMTLDVYRGRKTTMQQQQCTLKFLLVNPKCQSLGVLVHPNTNYVGMLEYKILLLQTGSCICLLRNLNTPVRDQTVDSVVLRQTLFNGIIKVRGRSDFIPTLSPL